MSTPSYIIPIQEAFYKAENKEKAAFVIKYLKNQFDSFGISSPIRKEITRAHIQQYHIPEYKDIFEICDYCWEQDQREFQYLALDLLYLRRKEWKEDIFEYFKRLVLSKSWWDTIDSIAPTLMGHYFFKYPENLYNYIFELAEDENFWNQRCSIIFQLKYKEKTNLDLLAKCILLNADSKEFFVRKAIGWALRQYSRFDPEWVVHFIENNELSGLSKREGLKWLKNKNLI